MEKEGPSRAEYQTDFSLLYDNAPYEDLRRKKAEKTLAVITDYWAAEKLKLKSVLEIGCYKGEISFVLAPMFQEYHAIDIDENAIQIALSNVEDCHKNLSFHRMNAEDIDFQGGRFDIVLCSHVYEHIPHPDKMMKEIYRVLKAQGICYFAGGNKYNIMEPHHRLPFLSWLPKKLANTYVKIFRQQLCYYETHYSLPALKRLVQAFTVADYTRKIVAYPEKFHADDMLRTGSLKQVLSLIILKLFYGLSKTYVWILEK